MRSLPTSSLTSAHGQRELITLFEDAILDGRHRAEACVRLGLRPKTRQFKGTRAEALDFVVSENLRRRHLDASQRAIIAEQLANMKTGTRTDLGGGADAVSLGEAARSVGVSRRSAARARFVRKHGTAKDVEAIRAGTRKLEPVVREVKARLAGQETGTTAAPSQPLDAPEPVPPPVADLPKLRSAFNVQWRDLLPSMRAVQKGCAAMQQVLADLAAVDRAALAKNPGQRPFLDALRALGTQARDILLQVEALSGTSHAEQPPHGRHDPEGLNDAAAADSSATAETGA